MPIYGENTIYTIENSNFQVTNQLGGAMYCAPPPPQCALEITGTTVTNVTVRGGSDGQIVAVTSGATGSTLTWYINGAVKAGQTGKSATFTGLAAGNYVIQAIQGVCFDTSSTITVLDGEFRTGTFIVNSPTGLTVTENPIIVTIRTATNPVEPTYSKSYFKVNSTINDNDSITIVLEYPQAYTAKFTAKKYPNRDDYFLASVLNSGNGNAVGSNTTTEIAKSIEEALSKDVLLSRLYDFRASTNYVYITAKEQNSKLNLNSDNVTITGTD